MSIAVQAEAASMTRVLFGLLICLSAPAAARASACNEEVVARIAMAAGRVCWVYRGRATTFVGAFSAGQRIVAHMTGEAAETDSSGHVRTSIQSRDPYASGPAKFYKAGTDGSLAFTTPTSGAYRFDFSPCAMWGGAGTVEICAR